MRRHLLIALIAMVAGPLTLLAVLAGKMLHDEEDLVQHRFRDLLEQRLDDSRSAITELVGELEVELVQTLEETETDREALRDLERGQPLVRQVFVVDAEGRRLHPVADVSASREEREFLERTRAIWEAKAELALVGPAEGNDGDGRADGYGNAYANNTWTLNPKQSGRSSSLGSASASASASARNGARTAQQAEQGQEAMVPAQAADIGPARAQAQACVDGFESCDATATARSQ